MVRKVLRHNIQSNYDILQRLYSTVQYSTVTMYKYKCFIYYSVWCGQVKFKYENRLKSKHGKVSTEK